MKKFVVLVAIALAGCASGKAEIHSIGDGLYMSGVMGAMHEGSTALKAELFRDANEFCKAKGLTAQPVSSTGREVAPYTRPTAEITFRCVANH